MISNNSLSKSMCVSYLQSSNMSHDHRSTVVRPSFDCRLSMLKLCSVLVFVLMVGVGDVWADISLYTEGWESNHRESGTNNYTTTTKTYGSWTFYRSDAISNTGISGSYLARCRVAGSSTDSPYIVSSALTLSTDHISQVSWKCKGTTNISLTAYYSTDGSNWSVGKSATSLPSSSTSWSFNLDVTGTLYLKFVFTVASSTNSSRDGEIDDITVTGSHAAASKYTVSFETGTGNPTQANITEASGGAGITLPSVTPTCSGDGWALYGWAISACGSETSTAPTIVGKPGDTYKPESNITLYAVYAKGEYTKETSAITAGGKYIFAANSSGHNYIMSNDYQKPGDYGQLKGKLIDETTTNKYHVVDVPADYVFTIVTSASVSVSSGDWMIKNVVDNKYVSPDFKNFYVSSIGNADGNTITWNSGNSGWDVVNVYGSTNMLQYDAENNLFVSASPATSLLIYKETTTPSYFSNPTCCTPLGTINGSISLSKGKRTDSPKQNQTQDNSYVWQKIG